MWKQWQTMKHGGDHHNHGQRRWCWMTFANCHSSDPKQSSTKAETFGLQENFVWNLNVKQFAKIDKNIWKMSYIIPLRLQKRIGSLHLCDHLRQTSRHHSIAGINCAEMCLIRNRNQHCKFRVLRFPGFCHMRKSNWGFVNLTDLVSSNFSACCSELSEKYHGATLHPTNTTWNLRLSNLLPK